MSYFRYTRQMLCATEVTCSHGIADVLAVSQDGLKSYEVEVKISLSDLKRELTEKYHKHRELINDSRCKCNYFYFCLPEELLDKALPILNKFSTKYGIITWKQKHGNQREDRKLKFYRKATRLTKKTNQDIPSKIVMRLSSEVICLRKKLLQL